MTRPPAASAEGLTALEAALRSFSNIKHGFEVNKSCKLLIFRLIRYNEIMTTFLPLLAVLFIHRSDVILTRSIFQDTSYNTPQVFTNYLHD